jgi:hypothetical protein
MRLLKAYLLLPALAFCSTATVSAQPIPAEGLAQIQAYVTEKESWTPAERKIQSTLLYASRFRSQGYIGAGLPLSNAGVDGFITSHVAPDSSVAVTIRGDINAGLVAALSAVGGSDIRSYPQFGRVTLRLPLASVLGIAQRPDVQAIAPTAKPFLNRIAGDSAPSAAAQIKEGIASRSDPVTNTGSVNWSGVLEHGADLAQNTGINGGGVKVCVLSDSADPSVISGLQASGDLPATVDVLENAPGNTNEGAAMMEIVYDMAPGVALGFATAFVSDVDFASNIVKLQQSPHSCNVIVDDVTYDNEGAFQDGIIAQAVSTVTSAGALYFSSAANSNNLAHNTSGTWEGDFVDGGPNPLLTGGTVHSFGANAYDVLTARGFEVTLQWSDPLGASNNDYDLFILDPTGATVVGSGNSAQTGTQDPFEFIDCFDFPAQCPVNGRVVIFKHTGAAVRALRIDTMRGRLSVKTNGSTYGHNAAATAYTVAAVNLASHTGSQFSGSESNQAYSSDGPRKMFYAPDGTAITPGNILFGTDGGTTLNKVDITAGDCGHTVTFPTFCGTSASAPTAGSIAAMLKQAKPSLTASQIQTALFSTAIDIEAAGDDVTAGHGIVMADRSLRSVLGPLIIAKTFVPASIAPTGTSVLTMTVSNPNAVALNGIVFTDTYPTGVVNTGTPNAHINGASCAGTLAAGAGGNSLGLTEGVVPALASCTYKVNVTSSTSNVYVDSSGAVTTPIALNTAAQSATLTVGTVGAPPVFSSAVSRKVHGSGGTFDLLLSLVTPPAINHNPTTEPRQGPAHTIVFTFDKPIASAIVTISEGTAIAGSPTFSGNDVVVALTGVVDQQYVTVSLNNVTAGDGGTGGSGSIRVGFLAGDVSQNRVVTVSDEARVNALLAQTVTASNFLKDVNASGTLSVADRAIVNANLTRALPAP